MFTFEIQERIRPSGGFCYVKYRLINMDNRDAGDSAPGPGPYTIADMADDAAGLIQNLKCGPTYVIGWSMGGFIALELSLRHPKLVDALILVATSAGGSAYFPPAHEVGVLLMPHEKEDLETLIRRIYPCFAAPDYMNSHPEDLDTVVPYSKSKPMSLSSEGHFSFRFRAITESTISARSIGLATRSASLCLK